METAQIILIVGLVVWWAGYFPALVIAWRAGERSMATAAAAGIFGICGCFGVPILAYLWSRVQKRTFDAVVNGPDDAPAPPHMRHFQVAAGIAFVGMLIQLVATRL